MPMPSLSRDTQRKYAILRAIDTMERPSLQDIASETGIPAGTVKRQLTSIREELKVKILFILSKRKRTSLRNSWMVVKKQITLKR